MTPLLRGSSVLRFTLVLAAGACAAGGAIRVSDVTPESIPALEAERGQRPQDPGILARLGVAYFKAQRYGDARLALDSAVAGDPRNGVAAIYLGMTAEQLGDFAAARAAYQHYLDIATDPDLKATARQRLALVDRRQLEYQARQALASESQLAAMPPESNTVAVMPFVYRGTNADLRVLGRGFAQLLVTDLAKSRQIRVLERERMQAMLDEMKLGDSALTTPASAVRSGHLLQAARVVQGALGELPGDRVRVDAALVNVSTARVQPPSEGTSPLDQLFDLEKQIAFAVFNNLGIQLSPAEQDAISQRPTQNLQAFLAYSRGLVDEDRGDYAAAQAEFNQAATLDPNFRAASQSAAAASELSAAAQQPVSTVENAVSQAATFAPPPSPAPVGSAQAALEAGLQSVAPPVTTVATGPTTTTATPTTTRNTTSEATQTEGPAPVTGTVVIIIRRP
jgi:tetratricopeptide (TPR) repeat protein